MSHRRFFFFAGLMHSVYFSCIKTRGGQRWSPGPLHGDAPMELDWKVSEFLTWKLGLYRGV